MKAQSRSGYRLLSVTGAALLLAFLAAPREASARLYRPTDPPFPEGDPTADDQPSPTPKQGRYAIPVMPNTNNTVWTSKGRMIWLSYIRAWIRIAAR
jgi:hypothetical protein